MGIFFIARREKRKECGVGLLRKRRLEFSFCPQINGKCFYDASRGNGEKHKRNVMNVYWNFLLYCKITIAMHYSRLYLLLFQIEHRFPCNDGTSIFSHFYYIFDED
jgi:hypothetical protein